MTEPTEQKATDVEPTEVVRPRDYESEGYAPDAGTILVSQYTLASGTAETGDGEIPVSVESAGEYIKVTLGRDDDGELRRVLFRIDEMCAAAMTMHGMTPIGVGDEDDEA